MYPLIEITTVPIEIEIKTTRAKLEPIKSKAEVEITRDKSGGVNIKSRPIKVSIDTFQPRNNNTMPTLTGRTDQLTINGKQAGYSATATYAQQGELLLNGRVSEELALKFSYNEKMNSVPPNTSIQFLTDQTAEDDQEIGELNIRYEMDKLNFDWRTSREGFFKFTPGDIQLTITQRPEVLIKYIGGPIYVPPSSDPDYVPVDVNA